eukprot:4356971-Prymnesium_polylepis.5
MLCWHPNRDTSSRWWDPFWSTWSTTVETGGGIRFDGGGIRFDGGGIRSSRVIRACDAVRANGRGALGFISDRRRINVAMSRARRVRAPPLTLRTTARPRARTLAALHCTCTTP